MPVWHDVTRKLRDEGRIQLVGVIQEQHPDRCKLFMQWKQMDWPVLVDPLNLLEVGVVPLALLVDENGIVREVLRDPRRDFEKLTARSDSVRPTEMEPAPQEEHTSTLRHVHEALQLAATPRNAASGKLGFSGYALYGVCKGDEGTCLYRRSDMTIPIEVAARR